MPAEKLRPDVIFFDYGDTLVADTTDRHGDIARWLGLRDHAIDAGDFARGWAAAEEFAATYAARHGGRKWLRDRFWYTFLRTFLGTAIGPDAEPLAEEMHADPFFTNTIYPDTLSTLSALRRRGYRLGIISNWEAPTLPGLCDRFDLTPHFAAILPSREAEAAKPDPHIFRTALERMRVAPERAIHVGDSYSADVVGARGVGITPVWINPDRMPTPDGVLVHEIRTRADLLDLVA